MRVRNVHYNLQNGFIHNWLVAGPQAIAIEARQFKGDNIRQQIARHFYTSDSGITETPVERGPLTEGLFQVGDYKGSWEYLACREDHLVENSGFYCPVITTTGMFRVDSEFLISSKTANPSNTGIIKSSRTRAGCSRWMICNA